MSQSKTVLKSSREDEKLQQALNEVQYSAQSYWELGLLDSRHQDLLYQERRRIVGIPPLSVPRDLGRSN